ncbi:MAG: copper-binding protein [Thermoanaerobaculia bacterium]
MRNAAAGLLLFSLFVSCSESNVRQEQKPLSEAGEKLYVLKGKVTGRDAGDNTLTVDHEAIPGYMEAMTMDYPVRGVAVATLPGNASAIEATLHVRGTSYWLTQVKRRS